MFTVKGAQQRDPEVIGGIRLPSAEGRDADRPVVDGNPNRLKDAPSLRWLTGEQRRCEKVMGFAAAHGLLEAEHALVAAAHEAVEDLPQEDTHALGDVCLSKERPRVELGEVGNLGDRVAAAAAEDRRPGPASRRERSGNQFGCRHALFAKSYLREPLARGATLRLGASPAFRQTLNASALRNGGQSPFASATILPAREPFDRVP
jgi:hypothetical protein